MLYSPVKSKMLDSMNLIGLFQFEMFCDSMILSYAVDTCIAVGAPHKVMKLTVD